MLFIAPSTRIEKSISKLGSDVYQMGTYFVCRKVKDIVPKEAVASWKDDDGYYCLLREACSTSLECGKPADGLIHHAGLSSAVWKIGSSGICKVKTWAKGMEKESDTLAFVSARFPFIQVPEVIYSWLDEELQRTFLILKHIEGPTLQDTWPSLTPEQKQKIGTTIAQYCFDLAKLTSDNLQSATGCGVLEPFLSIDGAPSHPSWKPRPLGPLRRIEVEKYFQKISTQPYPPLGDVFHFYHADLSPTNIILSEDHAVKAILDWESAGFYPKFWVHLKPYRSPGFNLPTTGDSRWEWADIFRTELDKMGFALNMEYVEWNKTIDETFFNVNELLNANLEGL